MRMMLFAALAALGGAAAQAQPPVDARGAPPPSGDYWRSCQNVSTYGYGDNTTMTAQCRDDRGRWRQTSLRVGNCREVTNIDGNLTCGRGGDGGGRPPWGGGGGWRGGSITLYGQPGFAGRQFYADAEITNLPKRDNDRAQSLRITGRGAWQVCSDSDFRGRCQTFDRDVRDLRPYGLDRTISSMRPVR